MGQVSQMQKFFQTENVYLYLANIIDYVRAILVVLAYIAYSQRYGMLGFWCFATSIVLDEFDGRAARWLKQVSTMGGFLDDFVDMWGPLILAMASSSVLDSLPINLFFLMCATINFSGHFTLNFGALNAGYAMQKYIPPKMLPGMLKWYYGNEMNCSYAHMGSTVFLAALLTFIMSGSQLSFSLITLVVLFLLPSIFLMTAVNFAKISTGLKLLHLKDMETKAEKKNGATENNN